MQVMTDHDTAHPQRKRLNTQHAQPLSPRHDPHPACPCLSSPDNQHAPTPSAILSPAIISSSNVWRSYALANDLCTYDQDVRTVPYVPSVVQNADVIGVQK